MYYLNDVVYYLDDVVYVVYFCYERRAIRPEANKHPKTYIEITCWPDVWEKASALYPTLAKAALQLLCISIGSVDAERSFSKMRNV